MLGGELKGRKQSARDLWQKKQRGKEEGTKKGGWGRKKCGEGRLTIGRLWLYRIARVGMLVWVAEPTNRQNKAGDGSAAVGEWATSQMNRWAEHWANLYVSCACVCVRKFQAHSVNSRKSWISISLAGISKVMVLQHDYTHNAKCFSQTVFTETVSWINTLLAI